MLIFKAFLYSSKFFFFFFLHWNIVSFLSQKSSNKQNLRLNQPKYCGKNSRLRVQNLRQIVFYHRIESGLNDYAS